MEKDTLESVEILYIHLQKRKMELQDQAYGDEFTIFRDEFRSGSDLSAIDWRVDSKKEEAFQNRYKQIMRRQRMNNLRSGAIKHRIAGKRNHWKGK